MLMLLVWKSQWEDCWTKKSPPGWFAYAKLSGTSGSPSILGTAARTGCGTSSHTCAWRPEVFLCSFPLLLPAPTSGVDFALPRLATTATYGASYRHRSLRCPTPAASWCCLHPPSGLSLGKHRSGPQSSVGPGLAHYKSERRERKGDIEKNCKNPWCSLISICSASHHPPTITTGSLMAALRMDPEALGRTQKGLHVTNNISK